MEISQKRPVYTGLQDFEQIKNFPRETGGRQFGGRRRCFFSAPANRAPPVGEGCPGIEDWINCFCTMEMRLKIVEASAEHDFVLRGSSECFVQCSASNFYSRTAFPNWRGPVCRRGKKAAPSASESYKRLFKNNFGSGTCIERFRLRCLGVCFFSICGELW